MVDSGESLRLLQLIVLVITAEIYISQFVLKLVWKDELSKLSNSEEGSKMIERMKNSVQLIFISILSFLSSGASLTLHYIFAAVPREAAFFLSMFDEYMMALGVSVILFIVSMAIYIGGEPNPENRLTASIFGTTAIGALLTGSFSLIALILYLLLWAATRSLNWVFFIGLSSFALGMLAFFLGLVYLGEQVTSVMDMFLQDDSS